MKTYSNKEAANLLRSRLKPYNYVTPAMKESNFSQRCTRLEHSLMKPMTAKEFLYKFGFSGEWDKWTINLKTWGIPPKRKEN